MKKMYICCPKCKKKLFRVDEKSRFDNIYVWCKECKKEILIKEPVSRYVVNK